MVQLALAGRQEDAVEHLAGVGVEMHGGFSPADLAAAIPAPGHRGFGAAFCRVGKLACPNQSGGFNSLHHRWYASTIRGRQAAFQPFEPRPTMADTKRCFSTNRALRQRDPIILSEVLRKFPGFIQDRGIIIPNLPDDNRLDYETIRNGLMAGDVPTELDNVLFFANALGNKRGQEQVEREAEFRGCRLDFRSDGLGGADFALKAWLHDWPANKDLLEAAYARAKIFSKSSYVYNPMLRDLRPLFHSPSPERLAEVLAMLEDYFANREVRRNNLSNSVAGMNRVVPIAVKVRLGDFDPCQLIVAHGYPRLVLGRVQRSSNQQTLLCSGVGNQVHDDFVSSQRPAAPVLRDEAEQAMLNLVPLARTRREMTHVQAESYFVGQFLQSHLPESIAAAVAPAAIGRNHQSGGARKSLRAHLLPPPPNACRGESRGIVVNPHAHPTFVAGQIIDSIGDGLANARIRKVVHADFRGLSTDLPLASNPRGACDSTSLF